VPEREMGRGVAGGGRIEEGGLGRTMRVPRDGEGMKGRELKTRNGC